VAADSSSSSHHQRVVKAYIPELGLSNRPSTRGEESADLGWQPALRLSLSNRGLSLSGVILFLSGWIFLHYKDPSKVLVAWNEYLESYNWFGVISVLDLCGSILACRRYRQEILPKLETRRSWFETLLTCAVLQFGGTTLTGLVLGQTPSWILSHTAFPALLLAWWLTFACPLDLFYKLLSTRSRGSSNLPTEGLIALIEMGSCISYAHAITSWGMDKALFNTFHVNFQRISQSLFTSLLCGTLSGSGGGLLVDWLGWTGRRAGDPVKMFSLHRDGFNGTATLNKSFWLALLYYRWLSKDRSPANVFQGHLIVGLLSIASYLFQTTFTASAPSTPEPTIAKDKQGGVEGEFAANDIFQHLSVGMLRLLNVPFAVGGPIGEALSKEQGVEQRQKLAAASKRSSSRGRSPRKKD